MIRSSHEKTLDRMVRELVEEFDPEQIFLFGSHARGEGGPDSDLDLLVIVRESDETPTRRAVRAHRRLADFPVPKDILVRTRAEFDRFRSVPSSLAARIEREGRAVHG